MQKQVTNGAHIPSILYQATSLFSSRSYVTCLEPSQGLEVMRVVQSLSSSSSPAAKAWFDKRQKWIPALRLGYLPRHMMWTALIHVIWRSLRYPLGVQLHKAASHLFQTILPKVVTTLLPCLHFALPQHHGLAPPQPILGTGHHGYQIISGTYKLWPDWINLNLNISGVHPITAGGLQPVSLWYQLWLLGFLNQTNMAYINMVLYIQTQATSISTWLPFSSTYTLTTRLHPYGHSHGVQHFAHQPRYHQLMLHCSTSIFPIWHHQQLGECNLSPPPLPFQTSPTKPLEMAYRVPFTIRLGDLGMVPS